MDKSTISMAMFHSNVNLPEGKMESIYESSEPGKAM